MEEWCTKLSAQPLKSQTDVYCLKAHWHHNGSPHVCTFFPQAKEHYCLFTNGMTVLMNSQFEGDGGEVFGNLFKGQKNSDQVAM